MKERNVLKTLYSSTKIAAVSLFLVGIINAVAGKEVNENMMIIAVVCLLSSVVIRKQLYSDEYRTDDSEINKNTEKKVCDRKMKKLYRSRANRTFLGLCGGIAEYMNVDVTIVRILTVILGIASGAGFLVYILAALLIEEEPEVYTE